jgi:cyclopropane fatty-acyl-phospholipid synthase-like methyltransferase
MQAMPPSAAHALTLVSRSLRRRGLVARSHALFRLLTCPFLRVAAALPPAATLLDIGAGHGTFAVLAAAAGARKVIALEPDLRRAFPPLRQAGVCQVTGFDPAVAGSFDAVSMIDVLYKLPRGEWDALFARVFARLRPGGVFLLKELDPGRPLKALWNRAQEHLANAVNLTLGRTFAYETRRELGARLERAGFSDIEARDLGRGYPHAHVLYVARRRAAGTARTD